MIQFLRPMLDRQEKTTIEIEARKEILRKNNEMRHDG
jgi:hypothetical protein